MSQSTGYLDGLFDENGDIQVTDDEMTQSPTPPQRSAAGDGAPRPQPQQQRRGRRGLVPGTKRGPYKRTPPDARQRVLDVYKAGGDWKLAAEANGINTRTAYGYITKPDGFVPARRGGATATKVSTAMEDKMIEYVEENPLVTLAEIGRKLHQDMGVSLSTNTIHKHLNGRLYTVKKVLAQPVGMNSQENREKRAQFVRKVMEATGQGRTLIYMDETNVNLFLRRSQGRARRGTRCSVLAANSKGPNVHVIGAMSQTGMIHWERRRGSFRKEDCGQWLRRTLQACHPPLEQVTVICDNAPAHTDLETVVAEFPGVELLRTAPYSAPLNPIEAVWSSMKASMKAAMAASFDEMMNTAPGLTQQEHRLRFLEARIDAAMERITPVMCLQFCNHVQRHYAGCMALADLSMGV